ncbi:MAG: hypothetical protein A2177_00185 [Spirochaetes bacterium RBG_13_68_11]|nr:MAG: hypothetical protein A2177_00185 [Spirochaetes bacterium RBG_13_68_11]
MKRKRILALLAVFVLCVPGFGATLSTDELEAHVGILTIGDWTGGTNGLSSPLFLLGASMLLDPDPWPDPWVLGLGLDFLGAWYEWDDVNRRAFLSETEAGASFFTVGLLISPRIGARFAPGQKVAMGADFGLDLLIRFPFDPFSSVSIVDEQLPALVYFLAGRFLYPELGGWLTWQATEDVKLAFALRSLWPIYRIWSPEVTGFSTFLHQAIFTGTLGMTFRLRKPLVIGRKREEPAAPEGSAEPASP